MTTLREAIEQTVAILGPEAPLCSGCVDEWTEALRILNDALAEQSAEPVAWRYQNMEHMAEEAECVAMCLNDRGVPVREGAKSLSLWGRVEQYAKPRFINGMHTKDPSISREHLLALAKVCGIVGNYTTREFVDSVTGYAQVVLRDPAVQEAFVEANAHMLYTAPQPQLVKEPEIDGATIAGMDASIGHLSALVDELRLLLGCAMDNFKMLHQAAKHDDGPDMDAIIPANVFAKFVDQDAALRYAIKHSAHDGMITILPAPQPQPKQSAERGEPVYMVWLRSHCAWLHTDKEGFDKTHDDERWMLYTAPQPAKRPLTDEEIFKMVNPTQYHPSAPEGWVRFGFSRKHLIGFARAIERAHGIGGGV
jgi:hypothetical protein